MTLKMGRRNFLKTAAALAAISVMPPIIKKSHAYVNAKDDIDTPLLTQKKRLAKETRPWKFPLWVSALWE